MPSRIYQFIKRHPRWPPAHQAYHWYIFIIGNLLKKRIINEWRVWMMGSQWCSSEDILSLKILIKMQLLSTDRLIEFRIIPNKRTLLINAPPIVWGSLEGLFPLKMAISPLIIDRFSIRNQHWKAGKWELSNHELRYSLANAPARLLEIIRYLLRNNCSFWLCLLAFGRKVAPLPYMPCSLWAF